MRSDIPDVAELLQRLHPSQALHRSFSSSEWEMRVFHGVVGPASGIVFIGIADFGHRCFVGTQAIGGDSFRRAMALERLLHKRKRCHLVASFGRK